MNEAVLPYGELDYLKEKVRFGDSEDVRTLIRAVRAQNPTRPLAKYSCLLGEAIRHRQYRILDILLSEGVPVSSSAVVAAAKAKSYNTLAAFFDHGWDVNEPLSGSQPPVLSKVLDDEALVIWLLERGADPCASCDIDETPLAYAVKASPRSIVDLFLQQPRDLTKGQLMHCAVDREPPDLMLIRMLAEHGAPVDNILWQDPKSYRFRGCFTRGTPLHRACEKNNLPVAKLLLQLRADPDKMCMKDNKSVRPTPREIAYAGDNIDMMNLFACENEWM